MDRNDISGRYTPARTSGAAAPGEIQGEKWTLVTATATGTPYGCRDAALRSLLRSVD